MGFSRTFRKVPEDTRRWQLFFKDLEPDPGSMSLATLEDSAALSVLGRAVDSPGTPASISAGSDGQALRRNGTTLGFGTIATAGITDDAVTDAKLRDSAALSVIGRSANTTGNPADIAAASDGQVLRRSGTAIGFGEVATAGISDNAVTNAKLADMAQDTIKGRTSGSGTGDPVDLTAAQVATIVSSAIASALNITSSVYTPTLTHAANIDASTAYECQYLRVGSVVVVSGRADVDTTAGGATLTQLGISLPVASNFGSSSDCGGAGNSPDLAALSAGIYADPAGDRAILQWYSNDTSNRAWFFIFMYQVI